MKDFIKGLCASGAFLWPLFGAASQMPAWHILGGLQAIAFAIIVHGDRS